MKIISNQRRIAVPLLFAITAVLLVGGVTYWYKYNKSTYSLVVGGQTILTFAYPHDISAMDFREMTEPRSVILSSNSCFLDDGKIIEINFSDSKNNNIYYATSTESYAALKKVDSGGGQIAKIGNANFYHFTETYHAYQFDVGATGLFDVGAKGIQNLTPVDMIGPELYVKFVNGSMIEVSISRRGCGYRNTTPVELSGILNSIVLSTKFNM